MRSSREERVVKSEVLFSSQLDASRSEHDVQICRVGPGSGIRCTPFLRVGHKVLEHYADLLQRTHALLVSLIRHREAFAVTMASVGASYWIPPPVLLR